MELQNPLSTDTTGILKTLPSMNDFKREFNWINPWSLTSTKMNLSPLMTMNLPPLLFDWDKIPADYHHLRPPLYKNIRFDGTSENRLAAPVDFSIGSITRRSNIDIGDVNNNNNQDNTETVKNRGRPSAYSLQILKQKSMENPLRFKCSVCMRSFPRKKSLDTHKLIHSDLKPYQCTFPNCTRKFKQSGQLKTHFRLHTGEKPFICTFPRCETAFTHSNRKCPTHPEYPLRRMAAKKTNDSSRSFENMFGLRYSSSYKRKVDAWLSNELTVGEISKTNSVDSNRTVLSSIENTKEINKSDNTTVYEESNKRLLSAVALVEMHDQTKTKMESNNQGLLNTLFSITK